MNIHSLSKVHLFTMLMLVMALLIPQWSWAQTPSQPKVGDGSEDNPFQISTAAELAWFRDWVNGTYTPNDGGSATAHPTVCAFLTDDIDLKEFCHDDTEGEELSWTPIGIEYEFKGTFDGKGKTISNLYIHNVNKSRGIGLFGTAANANIMNISMRSSKVIAENSSNCGIVLGKSPYSNEPSNLVNLKTSDDCVITGDNNIGGIAGRVFGYITNCENHATVNCSKFSGGICADINVGTIKTSANYGKVNGSIQAIGGITGSCTSTIQDCANYGTIKGMEYVGGIVGVFRGSKIINVLGFGDIDPDKKSTSGLIYGLNASNLSLEGLIAYNKDHNKNAYNDEAPTSGAECIQGFTTEQIKSGEVAYLLNGSTSTPTEGTSLAWYQKLGENGDDYPVLTSTDDNTVYHYGKYYKCDGKTIDTEKPCSYNLYSNDATTPPSSLIAPHETYGMSTEQESSTGLYYYTCTECQAKSETDRYIKDFCGIADHNLRLTKETDGTYHASEAVTIADKAAYNSPVDFTAEELTYTRKDPHTEWQVMYVPFDMDFSTLADNGLTAACISNFHEYEKDGGTEVVLEVKEISSGMLKANVPYVVKAAASGEKEIHVAHAALHKAQASTVNCQSVTRNYDFCGSYAAQTGFNAEGASEMAYTLAGGQFLKLSQTARLSPMRWYLAIKDRNGSGHTTSQQAARVRSIRLNVIGSGEATGIEDIQVITGSQASSRQGIYDLQGRRLDAEPAHGVYIKNGKKIIK